MKDISAMNFGEALQYVRKSNQEYSSRIKLSARTGVDTRTISYIEKGEIDTKEYNERGAILERQIQSLTEKRAALEEKSTASKLAIMRVDQVMQALQSAGNIEKNNGELFRAMVDVVVVRNTYTLEFHLKAGITESVTIQR